MEREQQKIGKKMDENPEATGNNKKRNTKKGPKLSTVKLEVI